MSTVEQFGRGRAEVEETKNSSPPSSLSTRPRSRSFFFFFFFFFCVGYKQPKRTQNEDTSAPHSVFQHALMTHYIAKEPLVARRRKLTRLIALLLTMLFLLLIDQVFLSLDRHATTSSGVVVAVGVRPSLPEKDRLLGCSPALVLAASAARFELCQRCWW